MGLFDLFKKKKEEPVKNAPTTTQAPRKPACEHGECVVCTVGYEKEELFCTCDKTVSCPKKQQYKIPNKKIAVRSHNFRGVCN